MSFDNKSDSLFSDDEDDFCPLCVEEMDITDKNFKPCPCGYQICQFCYNNIRNNPELNGRCPGCRRLYDDESIEYRNITAEEWKIHKAKLEKKKKERKIIEKEKKDAEQAKRHHLAGMRVIQKNLVYVVGLNPPCSYDEIIPLLKSDKYFGQYGKITKMVINKRQPNSTNINSNNNINNHMGNPPSGYGVYVTFARKEDASKCIAAVDGSISDGKVLKAAHGTTKYCSSYLRGQPCPNPGCMFLHEPGEEADSYFKNELANKAQKALHENAFGYSNNGIRPTTNHTSIEDLMYSPQNSPHSSIAQLNSSTSVPLNNAISSSNDFDNNGPALPPTVSWAKSKPQEISSLTDHIQSSAFPTLKDVLQQNKSNSNINNDQLLHQLDQNEQHHQQEQLHNLLQKQQSECEPSVSKKKEKKDKDQHMNVMDGCAISFKTINDSLKDLNSNPDLDFIVDTKFKQPEFSIVSSNIKMFHSFNSFVSNVEKEDQKEEGKEESQPSFGFFNSTNKDKISQLTDSILFSPYTRNYNYRAYIQALQTAQAQAQAQALQVQALQAQALQALQANRSVGDISSDQSNMNTSQTIDPIKGTPQGQQAQLQSQAQSQAQLQAFIQQKILQQNQNKTNGVLNSGNNSTTGTPITAPPGLYHSDPKTNSQELLSQLLSKKTVA